MNSIDLAWGLVKQFEGFQPTAYADPTGVITIGYGTTGPTIKPKMVITEAQGEDLARQRLLFLRGAIEQLVHRDLNDNQMGSVMDFCYNVGMGNFGRSTMLNYLCQGAWGLAAEEFPKWTSARGIHLPGLTRRRLAEKALFSTPL